MAFQNAKGLYIYFKVEKIWKKFYKFHSESIQPIIIRTIKSLK